MSNRARAVPSRGRAAIDRLRNQSGQAALEFLLSTAVVLAMVAILAVVLFTVRERGGRVLDLVGSEYP